MNNNSFQNYADIELPIIWNCTWKPGSKAPASKITIGQLVADPKLWEAWIYNNANKAFGMVAKAKSQTLALIAPDFLNSQEDMAAISFQEYINAKEPELAENWTKQLKAAKAIAPCLMPTLKEATRDKANYKRLWNGLFQVDFDHIPTGHLGEVIDKLLARGAILAGQSISREGVWALFVSPSWLSADTYSRFYNYIAKSIVPELEPDLSCKNLDRLRFISALSPTPGYCIAPLDIEPPDEIIEPPADIENRPAPVARAVKKAIKENKSAVKISPSLEQELILEALKPYLKTDQSGKLIIERIGENNSPAAFFKECPFKSDHTGAAGDKDAVLFLEPRLTFHCFHSHCEGRKLNEVLKRYNIDVYLDHEKGGYLSATAHNLKIALSRLSFGRLCQDTFSQKVGLVPNGAFELEPLDELLKVKILEELRQKGFTPALKASSQEYDTVLKSVAKENSFDGALALIERNLPKWDKQPRVSSFLHDYFKPIMPDGVTLPQHERYLAAASWYVWASLYMRITATKAPVKIDSFLTLIGPGGINKSSLAAALCPHWQFFSSEDKASPCSKDSIERGRASMGKIVIEAAELEKLDRTDFSIMKNEVTKAFMGIRFMHKDFERIIPKRFIYIGTANTDPLNGERVLIDDKAGNRRFLPVLLPNEFINLDGVAANYWQMLAETKEAIEAGQLGGGCQVMRIGQFDTLVFNDSTRPLVKLYTQKFINRTDLELDIEDYLDAVPRSKEKVSLDEIKQAVSTYNTPDGDKGLEIKITKTALRLGWHKVRERAAGCRFRWFYNPKYQKELIEELEQPRLMVV